MAWQEVEIVQELATSRAVGNWRRLCPHFDRYLLGCRATGAVTLSCAVATGGTKPLPSAITIP
jgi:hypothetical protein